MPRPGRKGISGQGDEGPAEVGKASRGQKALGRGFTDLVQGKKALAEIHALTQAGIAAIKLEKFRTELVKLVVDTALAML